MQNIVYNFPEYEISDHLISEQLFGANFLLGRDSLTGTYNEVIQNIGVTHIRYPGGELTESWWDITNPNQVPISRGGSFDTISEFIAYANKHSIDIIIVIPTKRYLSDINRGINEVSEFVEKLTSGVYGDISTNLVFEIGNEYYAKPGADNFLEPLTAKQYAQIASSLAQSIRENLVFETKIAVQMGRTTSDNEEIISHFSDFGNYFDAIVFHEYPWQASTVPDRLEEKFARVDAWKDAGFNPEVYITEWNQASNSNSELDGLLDYGLRQATTIITILAEAATYGVDLMSIWAVQQRNKTSLSFDEGNSRLHIPGEMFKMMSETLVNANFVSIDYVEISGIDFNFFAFESDSQFVVFASAGNLNGQSISVELFLPEELALTSYVWAQRLYTNGDPSMYRERAEIEKYTPFDGSYCNSKPISVEFSIDYEMIRLVFAKSDPGSDAMYLVVDDRDFRLDGGGGDDRIYGGSGDHILNGRGGDDWIEVSGGSNILRGGPGNDIIIGGNGNDRINGGPGVDILYGGGGSDVFIFNSVSNIGVGENRDSIMDFDPMFDKIRLKGLLRDPEYGFAERLEFVTGNFSGTAGEIIYDSDLGVIYGDMTGNGVADFEIFLLGAPVMTADNFII